MQLPGRSEVVVFVDALSPLCIREIRPLFVLLKSRCFLQFILVYVEDKLIIGGGEFEGFPWHGEQLVTHAQETAEREHRVGYPVVFGVDHQFVDLAHILILPIDHRPGSRRLTAPPRPVVPSATAKEQNQYDY